MALLRKATLQVRMSFEKRHEKERQLLLAGGTMALEQRTRLYIFFIMKESLKLRPSRETVRKETAKERKMKK